MSESLESAYRGRFALPPQAPSRGEPPRRSCLVACARAHDGTWLIRIEDIDPPRDIPGAGEKIIETLSRFGFESDEPVLWQHDRLDAYRETAARLVSEGKAFGCACSRHDIAEWHRIHGGDPSVYPGICRNGTGGRKPRASASVDSEPVSFTDRRLGTLTQNLEKELGVRDLAS